MELKNKISDFKIFDGLSSEDLDEVASICIEKNFNQDEIIIEEDSKGSDIFVILEGRVNVVIKSPSREDHKRLTTLRDGALFGEISFLEGGRRSAQAIALDKVAALRIDGKKLYELFDNNNRLGYLIMRNISSILAQRLCDINFRWRDNI